MAARFKVVTFLRDKFRDIRARYTPKFDCATGRLITVCRAPKLADALQHDRMMMGLLVEHEARYRIFEDSFWDQSINAISAALERMRNANWGKENNSVCWWVKWCGGMNRQIRK